MKRKAAAPRKGRRLAMKTVILAGGKGTRLAEETVTRPKPMVEIGGKPVLWHIMNIYAHHGFKDFVVACGYRGEMIVDYFRNFHLYNAEATFDLRTGAVEKHTNGSPDWRVTLVPTGLETQTGGRVRRLAGLLDGGPFMVTYGDGVGNVDVGGLIDFHRRHGKLATMTVVRPPSRFGIMKLDQDRVVKFEEKPQVHEGWINGGFMVFEPEVLSWIKDDQTILEREILSRLANEGELQAFRHHGFWQPMDNIREKHFLEGLWAEGRAPWKVWED